MRITQYFISFTLILLISGCSWLPEVEDETKKWSANKLYTEAKTALNDEDYELAIKYHELLEARYPFGRYAQQSQIEVMYAYYQFEEPDSALIAADRFIKLHPQHPNVDYVYYMKGIINYKRDSAFLDRFISKDKTTRDPGSARQAFFDFRKLVRKFPNSKYSEDAILRMHYLRNNLAKYEVNVANYYIKRGAYIAATNRAKYVIENYDQSPAIPEALDTLAVAYDHLGMTQLALDSRRVLNTSYPGYTKPVEKSLWWPPFGLWEN